MVSSRENGGKEGGRGSRGGGRGLQPSVGLCSKWAAKSLGGGEMGVTWFMFLKKSSIAVGRM